MTIPALMILAASGWDLSTIGLKGGAELTAIITGSIGVLGAIYRYIAKPAWKHYWTARNRITNLVTATEAIRAELKPNGGGSFRDHLDRQFVTINLQVGTVSDRLSSQERRTAMNTSFQRVFVGAEEGSAMVETDAAGHLVWAHPRLLDLTGLTLEELRNGAGPNAVHAEDRDRVVDHWKDCLDQHAPFVDTCRYVNIRTGVTSHVRVHMSPVIADDRLHGWVGVITKIKASAAKAQLAAQNDA